MPIDIDKPAKKRAVRPSITSDKKPTIQTIRNPSMEQSVTNLVKSNYNPDFELFEGLVDEVRKAVRQTVDYRKTVKDDSPTSISHYTNETIKKIIRASKWA